MMIATPVLHAMKLVPVVELWPWNVTANVPPSPSESGSQAPDAWHRWWQESLADAHVTGLNPVRIGSFHVAVEELLGKPRMLTNVLVALVNHWGGIEVFADEDTEPVLNGGLAMYQDAEVLVEPTCCADLGNFGDWKQAAAYRREAWQMLWIGHPWLSVRFESPWLILSQPHESAEPTDAWKVHPDDVAAAVEAAHGTLQGLGGALQPILMEMGVKNKTADIARKLAGLSE